MFSGSAELLFVCARLHELNIYIKLSNTLYMYVYACTSVTTHTYRHTHRLAII